MSAAATAGTYSPASAAGEKRRERKEELRRHLAEDADWPRADGRSFHDCRPACKSSSSTFSTCSDFSVCSDLVPTLISMERPHSCSGVRLSNIFCHRLVCALGARRYAWVVHTCLTYNGSSMSSVAEQGCWWWCCGAKHSHCQMFSFTVQVIVLLWIYHALDS